ncbi:VOC family protein [Amycolatopsis sp. EV170708-02-1]|uniref:VOC family protein n=1 Tax=Amycolatopsis sp. EV170708-02-1 TaxID=2919322 RepID=UPI001F0C5888|nr:VOC family protein [Amycolatopsis sp. EV170708-02-1]UMP01287.1 VOC family protein [Amycolatopsis sp. EV170708-02-1]
MATEITRLHHVGHVVRDLPAALDLYRRLGFVTPAPSYPAMPPREGGEPEPFGAANTHADFPGDFLELATVVTAGGRVPSDARLVPLQAPPDVLPTLVERIDTTRANLAECLERFEGLHILMFSSSDVDATATRLTAAGVGHGGVNTVRRPTGGEVETVRYLEIDGARPGLAAEGRIGVVADLDPRIQATRAAGHPNGAVGLVDAVLCTADADLDAARARYERYLGRTPRAHGPARVFDLDGATLTLVPASGLAALLPGEQTPALPALVSCTVAVHDLAAAENLLRNNEIPVVRASSGEVFVPATAAFGTAIAFRQA